MRRTLRALATKTSWGRTPRADDSPRASGCRSRSRYAHRGYARKAPLESLLVGGDAALLDHPHPRRVFAIQIDIRGCSDHRDRYRRLVGGAGAWAEPPLLFWSVRGL